MSINTMSSVVKYNLSRIQTFYKDKVVLLTGGTGFLGTVLVEKLLRSCPDIRCIYLLVREKNGMSAEERLNKLIKDPGFSRLKTEQPKFLDKLAVIQGDLQKPNLGLTKNDEALLRERVNVVLHSAATIKFNERLDVAIKTNLVPTKELCRLAKECVDLKSFVYISTAFANCERDFIPEKVVPPMISPEKLLSLVDLLDEQQLDKIAPNLFRPKPNTYVLSKSVAENVVLNCRSTLPVGILKPSIVGAALNEPAPGWLNNINSAAAIVYSVAAGRMHTFMTKYNTQVNLVPVDCVANATIALSYVVASQKWPSTNDNDGVPVINVVAKSYNCMTWRDFVGSIRKYVYENPSRNFIWYPFFLSPQHHWSSSIYRILFHHCPAAFIDFVTAKFSSKPTRLRKYYKNHDKYEEVMTYFSTRTFVFEEKNADVLWDQLDPQDQKLFPFNMKNIKWTDYTRNFVLGCRRYLLKEDDSTLKRSRAKIKVLYMIHLMANCTLVLVAGKFTWFILC